MFREVSLTDREWMESCRGKSMQEMTVLSFPAVYTWQSTFGLTIDGDERFYVVRSEYDGGYYYPVGDTAACRSYVMSLLHEEDRMDAPGQKHSGRLSGSGARNSSGMLKLVYVPESELEWLETMGFEITCEPSTSEYVYSSRSLALMDNASGTNYRVKIRHFSRDCEWSVRELAFPQDTEMLLEKTKIRELPSGHAAEDDHQALLSALRDPAGTGFSGIYIETKDGEWAYLLGYPSTDRIYDQSFVKYSPRISRNVVPVCISEMAKLVCDKYPYINLEDDLGIPGLRNMKMLYHPVFLLDSYTACIERQR